MCSELFHWKVATRWSPSTPSERSAWASCAARLPSSPKEIFRVSSPVQVLITASLWTVAPNSRIVLMFSCSVIIVLRMSGAPVGVCRMSRLPRGYPLPTTFPLLSRDYPSSSSKTAWTVFIAASAAGAPQYPDAWITASVISSRDSPLASPPCT